jgi:hypothetical protein
MTAFGTRRVLIAAMDRVGTALRAIQPLRVTGVYLKETVLAGAIRPSGRLTAVALKAEHRLGSSAHTSVTGWSPAADH